MTRSRAPKVIKPCRGEALSRPPFERMMRIHDALQAGRFPNARKLAETCEVSEKSIQRDLDFMRDRLHFPIEYDPKKWGYFYTKDVS